MKCPVCNQQLEPDENFENKVPLYQISYPGRKEYVSPRCSDCLDKLMARREKKGKSKS